MPTFFSSNETVNPLRHELPAGDIQHYLGVEALQDLINEKAQLLLVNANSGLTRRSDPEHPEMETSFYGLTVYVARAVESGRVHITNISPAVAKALYLPWREDARDVEKRIAYTLPSHYVYVPLREDYNILARIAEAVYPIFDAKTAETAGDRRTLLIQHARYL